MGFVEKSLVDGRGMLVSVLSLRNYRINFAKKSSNSLISLRSINLGSLAIVADCLSLAIQAMNYFLRKGKL